MIIKRIKKANIELLADHAFNQLINYAETIREDKVLVEKVLIVDKIEITGARNSYLAIE